MKTESINPLSVFIEKGHSVLSPLDDLKEWSKEELYHHSEILQEALEEALEYLGELEIFLRNIHNL